MVSVLSLALVAMMTAAGSLAYLTDTETVKNSFVMGNVDISLTEPNWPGREGGPKAGETMDTVPGYTEKKDPTLDSTTTNGDAYARLIVNITDGNNAKITDKSINDLIWTFVKYDEHYNDAQAKIKVGTGYTIAEINAMNLKMINESKYKEDTESKRQNAQDSIRYFNYCDTSKSTPQEPDQGYILKASDDPAILFTNIIIPADLADTDVKKLQGLTNGFQIHVTAEAIQDKYIDTTSNGSVKEYAKKAYDLMDSDRHFVGADKTGEKNPRPDTK